MVEPKQRWARPHGFRLGSWGNASNSSSRISTLSKARVARYPDQFPSNNLSTDATLGNGAFVRRPRTFPRRLRFRAQDRFPRPVIPDRLVGCSAFEYSSVGGGHACMRPETKLTCCRETIRLIPFPRSSRHEFDNDDVCIGFQLLNQASSRFKRTSNLRSHEGSAQTVKRLTRATAMEDQMVSPGLDSGKFAGRQTT